MSNVEWIPIIERPPAPNVLVETKIADEKGVRNCYDLVYHRGLFWIPDMSMYVYYTPTHWRPIKE